METSLKLYRLKNNITGFRPNLQKQNRKIEFDEEVKKEKRRINKENKEKQKKK